MIKEILERLRMVPFQPFQVRASNGEVFRVDHPENAAVVGGRVVIAWEDGDGVHMLSPLHIVAVSGADHLV